MHTHNPENPDTTMEWTPGIWNSSKTEGLKPSMGDS